MNWLCRLPFFEMLLYWILSPGCHTWQAHTLPLCYKPRSFSVVGGFPGLHSQVQLQSPSFLLNYSFVCLFVGLFISFFILPIRSLRNANTNNAQICFPSHSQVSVEDKLHIQRDRRRALPEEVLEIEKTLMSLTTCISFSPLESSWFSWVQLIKVVFQGLLKLLGETVPPLNQ